MVTTYKFIFLLLKKFRAIEMLLLTSSYFCTKWQKYRLKLWAKKGEAPGNFIEVMSCPGGCVNGCDTINLPKPAARQILPTTK